MRIFLSTDMEGTAGVVDWSQCRPGQPEYEYYLKENEYLLGTDLRSFWEWYFQGVIEPCSFCKEEVHRCSCEHYEDGKPAPIANPTWWKQVTKRAEPIDARIDLDAWASSLLDKRNDARRRDAMTS